MAVRGINATRAALGAGIAVIVAAASFCALTSKEASATGENRTLSMFNIHTKETITVTFKKDGKYDPDALNKLNVFMGDWRKKESRVMDPELIDLIWTLHKQLGSNEPVHLICGYRTSSTNEGLRRKGGGQAKNSQHILGKAADITFPDVPVKTLRNSALVQEWGGVGYYPTSGIPFVHVDTGHVRMWPRIPRLELAALFPDGKTGYLPADGRPITARDYQTALAKGLVPAKTMVATAKPKPDQQPVIQAALEQAADAAPKPILASYSPEPASAPAAAGLTAPETAPMPDRKRFVYASAGGDLPAPKPALNKPQGFPLYQSAEVVGAPEADDDHPDELAYVPFEIASLMSDVSVSYNKDAASLTLPEQKNISYLLDDMDHPLAATFRPSSGYRGLAEAQSFTGRAIRNLYAELQPAAKPTHLAQADR